MRGHLIVVASLAAEHRLQGACGLRTCGSETGLIGSGVVAHGLSCPVACSLPGPGIEPVSPALADGFLATGPPGKS